MMMTKEDALRRLQQLIHDPYASDESIEEVFLNAMAEDLLATGREYFRRRGRGMILFDLRGLAGWRRGDMPTMYYLTYTDLLQAGGQPSEVTEAEVNSYDPEREVPVIFLYDSGESGRVISEGWMFGRTA
jgi:hypothetical protein